MAKIDASTPYRPALSNWHNKVIGPKPTLAMFEAARPFVKVEGKQSLTIALAQRDCGVTAGQMKAACVAGWGNSGAHLNKMAELVRAGYFKYVDAPKTANNHKVYKLELTAKGAAKLAKAQAPAQAVPAVKAATTRRAKKAKLELPAPSAPEVPQPGAEA